MNRLDEIERIHAASHAHYASQGIDLIDAKDILALVAVARAAVAYVKADDPPYDDGSYTARQKAEDDMRAALAPLLASTAPDAGAALDEVAQMDHEDSRRERKAAGLPCDHRFSRPDFCPDCGAHLTDRATHRRGTVRTSAVAPQGGTL
jgi:hypothetical protein